MQYGNIRLSAGMFVGDPDKSRLIKEDCIYLFAAPEVDGIDAMALDFIGENGSIDSSFSINNGKILDVLKNSRDRSRGVLNEEEKQLKQLLENVQKDLGSITITNVLCLLSAEGKVVVQVRIEAEERGRKRIFKIGDKGGPIDTINVDELVALIEAKF